MAAAPNTVPLSLNMPNPTTWENLSKEAKNKFFSVIKSDASLDALVDEYNLVGIDLEGIRFQHFIESSLEENRRDTVESPEKKSFELHLPEVHPPEAHAFKPDTLTRVIEDTEEYKKELKPLQDARREKWEVKKAQLMAKWDRNPKMTEEKRREILDNRLDNPDSHAVKKLAEKNFRKKNAALARKCDEDVSAGSYDKDEIGKQYKQAARQHAEIETKNRLGKKLKKKQITEAQYREAADKLYHEKYEKNFAKQFIKDHKVKAEHYIQNKTDPILNNTWEEMRPGINKSNYKDQQKAAAKKRNKAFRSTTVHTGPQPKEVHPSEFENQSRDQGFHHPSQSDINKISEKFQELKFDHPSEFETPDSFSPIEQPAPSEFFGEQGMEGAEAFGAPAEAGALETAGTSAIGTEAAGGAVMGAEAGGLAAGAGATGGTAAAAATAPAWVPVVLIILGVLLLIALLVVVVIFFLNQNNQKGQDTSIPGLSITLIQAAPTIPNLGTADFTVNVICDATCKTQGPIRIYAEKLATGTSLNTTDKTKTTGTYTTTPYPISWLLADNTPTPSASGGDAYTFKFSLTTTSQINNVKIATTIYGDLVGGGSGTSGPVGDVPATTNNCNGKYTYYMSLAPGNRNFGDPNCDFTNNDLSNLINQIEPNPSRQKCYYLILANHESGYNANAYNGNSTSGNGAYGLFQMNPKSAGGESTYDVGDVYYKLGTQNAIKHNGLTGNNFAYWEAKKYDTQGWCQ